MHATWEQGKQAKPCRAEPMYAHLDLLMAGLVKAWHRVKHVLRMS